MGSNDAGQLSLVGSDQGLDLLEVVVGGGQGMFGEVGRHSGGGRHPEGRGAGAGLDQQGVGVAVVAAVELEDLVAPRVASGETDGAHGGLSTGGDHPDHLDIGIGVADHFGQLDLEPGGGSVGGPVFGCGLDGLHDLGMAVAEDHRSPGADVIDIGVAVGIVNLGTLGALNEQRVAAHRLEGPHGAVDPPGDDAFGFGEEGRGFLMVHSGFPPDLDSRCLMGSERQEPRRSRAAGPQLTTGAWGCQECPWGSSCG